MRYVASVSFGKDSLAMLLRLLEENKPLDEVVFYDTGMEFNAIYNIKNKVASILNTKGIKFTELKPKCSFEYCVFEKPVCVWANRTNTKVIRGVAVVVVGGLWRK